MKIPIKTLIGVVPMELVKTHYYNGTTCLRLFCHDSDGDYSPYATATINLTEKLPKNMVAIKSYGENEGILEALVSSHIISAPVHYVASGFVKIPICKIVSEEYLD